MKFIVMASFKGLHLEGHENAFRRNHETSSNTGGDRRLSVLTDDKKGVSFVELTKKEGTSLGLNISGGSDKGSKPRISYLRPGSIAYRSDCLAVGDYVLSVNGIRTSKLRHDEIVTLLKNAGDKITLEVEYEVPNSISDGSLCACPKVIQLKLEKENGSFGFTLRGGTYRDKLKSRPLIITHIRSDGPASRDGSIKPGDRLLAVDGINFSDATLQEALNVLKQLNGLSIFTIEYDVSVIDAVKNACGPLLVEIEKAPGSQLGVNLASLSVPEPAIVIESIRQASVAERCGALHVGDHILSIDDIKVNLMSSDEAMQLLKSSMSEIVKMEILPVSQMAKRRIPEMNVKKGGTVPHYVAARASFNNTCYNTLSSLGNFSTDSAGQFHSITPPLIGRNNWIKSANVFSSFGNHVSCPSLNSSLGTSVNGASPSVSHADTIEVILPTSFRGFGFILQSSTFVTHILTTPPVIRSIESGSIAEKCGVLQVGDRVLAVNNESTVGHTLDEVTQMIVHSHPKVVLKTEFDVTEAVVPSSGTFIIKLIKRGSSSLGISVAAPPNRQVNEPLIISDVENGSVSHRSGTIQPGDKLLAIDSVTMESCSVDDAVKILRSCGDIVTLRIQKGESFSDDPDVASSIVYTVELTRNGGPLGITISGTEESFKPILISGLTKNGLAERTGALHVGDRILAVNGISLKGKPLSEVVQMLQSYGDVVNIKISRKTQLWNNDRELTPECNHCTSESNMKAFPTPLSSIDSALESWDSCTFESSNCMQTESKFNDSSSSRNNLPYSISNDCKPSSSQSSIDSQHSCHGEWENRSHSSQTFYGASVRHSMHSDDERCNWSKALEDLQTCGESQLLRQIECTILGHDENNSVDDLIPENIPLMNEGSERPSDALSERSLQELNAQIQQLDTNFNDTAPEELPSASPEPTCSYNYVDNFSCDNRQLDSYEPNSSPSFSLPLPIEIHKVTLFKDQVYEDFGFSVSDAQYEQGVYIQCIRSGGPADLSGLIKPLDRILQVNNIKTYAHGCCLTVPLIASSGDRIELVVSRPAYDPETSSDSTLSRTCGRQSWVDDGEDNLLPFLPCSEAQTLTKTL